MGNPYTPRVTRRTLRETTTPLESFVARLARLGGSDDEIASVVESWEAFEDGWTAADRDAMTRWNDRRLVAELAAVRAEYREHTAEPASSWLAAHREATETLGESVRQAVGDGTAA